MSVHSSSGAKAASGSALRSSEFAATPPTDREPLEAGPSAASSRRRTQCADDRALVRGREIGPPPLDLVRPEVAHRVQERRLEPREREVESRDAGDREVERLGIALPGEPVDRGPPRVAETEEASALVERLARRVVERRPQPLGPTSLAHGEEERVPAAREQARERRLERIGLEVERGDVSLQVVDGNEWQPRPQAIAFAAEIPTRSAPTSPALRHGDSLDPVERDVRLLERRRTTGATSSRCRLDATSGTTPPKRAWSSACEETIDESTRPSRVTTAAAVSSQDVSMPRITTRARTTPAHAT